MKLREAAATIPVHQRLKGGIFKCGFLFFHTLKTPSLGSGHRKTEYLTQTLSCPFPSILVGQYCLHQNLGEQMTRQSSTLQETTFDLQQAPGLHRVSRHPRNDNQSLLRNQTFSKTLTAPANLFFHRATYTSLPSGTQHSKVSYSPELQVHSHRFTHRQAGIKASRDLRPGVSWTLPFLRVPGPQLPLLRWYLDDTLLAHRPYSHSEPRKSGDC